MDLYSSAILIAIAVTWIVARAVYKRKKRQEMTIFPPDRRKAVHVLETKDDVSQTF